MKKLILFTIGMLVVLVVSIIHILTSPENMKHHFEILMRGVLMGSAFSFFLWGLITIAASKRGKP